MNPLYNEKNRRRAGSSLADGIAHEADHQQWSRRSFLRNMGIAGSASMLLGNIPIKALSASPLAVGLANANSDRILVLIRLQGGNDGLNMIVPLFNYGVYQGNRPSIAVPQNQLIGLGGGELAMPNTMSAIHPHWLDGRMKVINNVGYPDQNLSHFRSSDIWASGSDANVMDTSGWLGRFLAQEYPDFVSNPPSVPPAVQIGGSGNILFDNSEEMAMGMVVSNPDELFEIAQTGELYDPLDVPTCYYGEQLSYLRTVANSTFRYAQAVSDAYNNSSTQASYGTSLGQQLALVARLIKGGLGTRLYMVTLDGFDTHAGQNNAHPALLNDLSEAINSFYTDLAGAAGRVISMTYSEFGRRIEQNASAGTDHGAAAPMMLFGEGLNGNGFLGGLPDLQNTDADGNLQFTTDFRAVYATLLDYWLCVDSNVVNQVMGQDFPRLDLGLDCNTVSTWQANADSHFPHQAIYGDGQITITYELAESMPVRVVVFDMLGRPVQTLFDGYQLAGPHQHVFYTQQGRFPSGIYVYRIQAGRQAASRQIRVLR